MTTAAPRGKRCDRCGCCDAVLVFEGEALCAGCDEGTHPPVSLSRPAAPPAPQPQRATPAPEPKSSEMTMHRLTPDEIVAIQAAPESESTASLAKRLGLKPNVVSYQRLVFQRKSKSGKIPQATEHPAVKKTHPDSLADVVLAHKETIRKAVNKAVNDAQNAPVPVTEDTPIRVTTCNAKEPPEPATALLCVDEDELDDWWDALDVEAKADAFVQWSLGNDGRNSHVYIEPGIPVVGTVGETEQPHLARPDALPEAPMVMDLLCIQCGERGGEWKRERLIRPNEEIVIHLQQRRCRSNDNSGEYIYTHECRQAPKGGVK